MLEDLWKPTGSPEHATQDAAEMNRLLNSIVFELKRLRNDAIDRFSLERTRRVPRCVLTNSADYVFGASSTTLDPDWDTETEDFYDMHSASTNPSRITIVEPGLYYFGSNFNWAPASTATYFFARVGVFDSGGTAVRTFGDLRNAANAASTQTIMCPSGAQVCLAGYYAEVRLNHDGTGDETVTQSSTSPVFYAYKIGGVVRED